MEHMTNTDGFFRGGVFQSVDEVKATLEHHNDIRNTNFVIEHHLCVGVQQSASNNQATIEGHSAEIQSSILANDTLLTGINLVAPALGKITTATGTSSTVRTKSKFSDLKFKRNVVTKGRPQIPRKQFTFRKTKYDKSGTTVE